jgi:tocopherol O-methyltransferase
MAEPVGPPARSPDPLAGARSPAAEEPAAPALRFDGAVGDLHQAIRRHYDGLIDLYEELWGEHIHHGYWEPGAPAGDRHGAQVRMVDELAAFGGVEPGSRVADLGCGVGATGIRLAARLGCRVEGVTISPAQVARGREKARRAGVGGAVRCGLADALSTPFAPGAFDVVWSLESCELMPDKKAFLAECRRILKPGGRLVVATWCSRDAAPTAAEDTLLRRIYRDFAAAYVLPLEAYVELCREAGLTEVAAADWTPFARATWNLSVDIVKPFVRNASFIWRLVRAKGADTFRFLNSVPLMKRAYDLGVMRYGVFRARR